MPDLVIFDCDGVLVDSEVLAVGAMCEVLTAAGVPATAAMVARCFGLKQADILDRIARDTGTPIPTFVQDEVWPATRRWFERDLRPMPGIALFTRTPGRPPALRGLVVEPGEDPSQPGCHRARPFLRRQRLLLATGAARQAGARPLPLRSGPDGPIRDEKRGDRGLRLRGSGRARRRHAGCRLRGREPHPARPRREPGLGRG